MLSVDLEKKFEAGGARAFQLKIKGEFSRGFTVLFGPSGAGKSTLLDCIAGLVKPDKGWIKWEGEVFFDAGKRILLAPQKRRIGYVFQSLALFPHLSVEENIGYGLSGLGAAQRMENIGRVASAFHIQDLLRRKPGELSGGEKQRAALARSVVTNPRILLLDEPLTGLDEGLRRAILEDLRGWNAEHRIPILYVTHNREEVDAIGDRVVTLVDGRVRGSGTPAAVLDAPRTIALAQAAGFENFFRARVVEHRAADGLMRVALDGSHCEVEIPLGGETVGEEVQIAIRAGDILLATHAPYGISARNILPGTVESLETRGTTVVVQVKAEVRFTVHVTLGAARSLELTPGLVVWLVLKTHSCHAVSPQ